MLRPVNFPAIKASPDDSFLSWDLSEMLFDELPKNPSAWTPRSENPLPHGHSNPNSNSNSGSNNSESYLNSDCANRADPLMDQRKQARMISNRESAKRSRMRKQKHLEELTNEVDRLKFKKAQLLNRLQSAVCCCERMSSDNEYLRIKNSILRENLGKVIPFQL